VPGLEVGLGRRVRELVPGAAELAVVATIDAVANGRAQVFRDCVAQFNGEIGNTAPRIEYIGRDDRVGGADVEACRATAAVIRRGLIDGKWQVGQQFAEEKPRARFAVDQVGVLADPSESRVPRKRFLEHGAAVDEHTIAERARDLRDAIGQLLQSSA